MVSQVTCYLLILYWYSRCYSCTERSNRSKLCKREQICMPQNAQDWEGTVINRPWMFHAETVYFALFVKATKFFVAGSTQTILMVYFYYNDINCRFRFWLLTQTYYMAYNLNMSNCIFHTFSIDKKLTWMATDSSGSKPVISN